MLKTPTDRYYPIRTFEQMRACKCMLTARRMRLSTSFYSSLFRFPPEPTPARRPQKLRIDSRSNLLIPGPCRLSPSSARQPSRQGVSFYSNTIGLSRTTDHLHNDADLSPALGTEPFCLNVDFLNSGRGMHNTKIVMTMKKSESVPELVYGFLDQPVMK